MAFDWVGAGLAAIKVGSGLLGADDAEEAMERAYEAQAALVKSKRLEEQRQLRRESARQRGTARAAIGASNIQFDGSSMDYLRTLDFENMRELAYMQDVARKEQYAILQGAQGAGDALRYQAYGDLIGYAAGQVIRNWSSSSFPNDQEIFDTTSAGREFWE